MGSNWDNEIHGLFRKTFNNKRLYKKINISSYDTLFPSACFVVNQPDKCLETRKNQRYYSDHILYKRLLMPIKS